MKYLSEFNKIDESVNQMCFSTLYEKMAYENSVHKKFLSKNVTLPNLCNALQLLYFLETNLSIKF